MERNEILSKVDHTLLAQTATWAEIRAICDDGMKYHTASVCIPASYVKQASAYVSVWRSTRYSPYGRLGTRRLIRGYQVCN